MGVLSALLLAYSSLDGQWIEAMEMEKAGRWCPRAVEASSAVSQIGGSGSNADGKGTDDRKQSKGDKGELIQRGNDEISAWIDMIKGSRPTSNL